MTRPELFSRLNALGATVERAERLGTTQRALFAALCGYKHLESVDQNKRVSPIVAGNVKGWDNMIKLDNWRKLTPTARETALDEFFAPYVDAAKRLAAKTSDRANKWQKEFRLKKKQTPADELE